MCIVYFRSAFRIAPENRANWNKVRYVSRIHVRSLKQTAFAFYLNFVRAHSPIHTHSLENSQYGFISLRRLIIKVIDVHFRGSYCRGSQEKRGRRKIARNPMVAWLVRLFRWYAEA